MMMAREVRLGIWTWEVGGKRSWPPKRKDALKLQTIGGATPQKRARSMD